MSTTPDPEALLVAALRSRPAIAVPVTTSGVIRISTRLSGTYPAIRVTHIGGPTRPADNTGAPQLQVECWGNGTDAKAEGQAAGLAAEVEAAADNLRGEYSPGVIVGSYALGDRVHSPDPATSRERYIISIGLLTQ